MSHVLRRKLSQAKLRSQQSEIQDALEKNASARQTVAPGNLMVVGGEKYDLSKDYAHGLPEGVDPDRVIPRFVCANGKVYDLDRDANEDLEVSMSSTYEIDGRVLTIGDFSGDGLVMVVELYEQFLKAHERDMESHFQRFADGHSAGIIDYVKDHNAKRRAEQKTNPATLEPYWTINWGDPTVTFEVWMEWTAATLRWRIKDDLQRRFDLEMDIRTRETLTASRDLLETTLIAVEKFLALPGKKRLLAV